MRKYFLILLLTVSFLFLSAYRAFSQNAGNTPIKPTSTWTIAFSPDDKYYVFGGDDSLLQIYTTANHKLYKWYKTNGMTKSISWHPRGKILAIANMRNVQLLNMETEQLSTVPDIVTGGRGIGWNYNGELLALADGRGVVQIMNKEGKLLRSITKYNNHTYMAMDWHPSKNIIVTGSDEIILFDTSGKQLNLINHRKEKTGLLDVKWHPSGEFFASGDYGHEKEGKPTLLQFWKADGTLIRSIMGHHSEIRNLRWNRNGTLLATASDALRVYTKDGKLVSMGKTSGYNLWGISWTNKGNHIITSSFEGNVDLWTNKAKLVKKLY